MFSFVICIHFLYEIFKYRIILFYNPGFIAYIMLVIICLGCRVKGFVAYVVSSMTALPQPSALSTRDSLCVILKTNLKFD